MQLRRLYGNFAEKEKKNALHKHLSTAPTTVPFLVRGRMWTLSSVVNAPTLQIMQIHIKPKSVPLTELYSERVCNGYFF